MSQVHNSAADLIGDVSSDESVPEDLSERLRKESSGSEAREVGDGNKKRRSSEKSRSGITKKPRRAGDLAKSEKRREQKMGYKSDDRRKLRGKQEKKAAKALRDYANVRKHLAREVENCRKMEATLKELETSNSIEKKAHEKTREELAQVKKQLAKLENNDAMHSSKIVQAELNAVKKVLAQSELDAKKQARALKEKEMEFDVVQEEMRKEEKKFAKERKSMQSKIDELQADNTKMKNKMAKAQVKFSSMIEENAKLKEDAKKRVNDKVSANANLRRTIELMTEEMEKLKQKVVVESESPASPEKMSDEVLRYRRQMETLNLENFNLSAKLADAERAAATAEQFRLIADAARKEAEEAKSQAEKAKEEAQRATAAARNAERAATATSSRVDNLERSNQPPAYAPTISAPPMDAMNQANLHAENDRLKKDANYWKREYDHISKEYTKCRLKLDKQEKTRAKIPTGPKWRDMGDQDGNRGYGSAI